MAGPDDLYAVLGVPPDADERAIKVAYVAALRAHPPETHPEEFRRIRAAYEVLADATARAGYDEARAAAQHADPEGDALWSSARAAHEAGDGESARRLLERLVELRPGALGAWHALGSVCMDLGRPVDAEKAFRRIEAEQSEAWAIHLDLARALDAQGRRAKAREAAARALERVGADLQAKVAVADVLAGLGDHDRARQLVEEVMAAEAAPRPIPPLVVRVARYHLAAKRAARAVEAVREAAAGWRGAPDEERAGAAGALAAFAAELYEAGKRREGDLVLAACHPLAPEAIPAPAAPALLSARELAPEDREWLEEGKRSGSAFAGQHRSPAEAWVYGGFALFLFWLLALAAQSIATPRRATGPGEWLGGAALIAFLGLATLALARAAWRRWRGRLGHGLVLDRAHLVRARDDRALVVPLLLLRSIRGKALPSGLLRLRFAVCGRLLPVTALFSSRDEADAFARSAMERRRELVQALSSGNAWDGPRVKAFAPASLLPGLGLLRRAGLLLDRVSWAGATAALALAVGCAAAGAVHGVKAEADARWRRIRAQDALEGYLALAASPSDPHAADAADAAAELLRRARAAYRAQAAAAPGAAAVEALLDPSAGSAPRVEVRVAQRLGDLSAAAGLRDPRPALQQVGDPALSAAFARVVAEGLGGATGRRDLPAVGTAADPLALTLVLEVEARVVPGAFRGPGAGPRLAVLGGGWELRGSRGGSPPATLGAGSCPPVAALAVPEATWKAGAAEAARAAYAEQQRQLLLCAAGGAASALGVAMQAGPLEMLVGPLGSRIPPPAALAGGRRGR